MLDFKGRTRHGITAIQPYVPGITDDELKKMYGLRHIVKLNANENALGPSPMALTSIQSELVHLHMYPDGSSERLREAIATYHRVQPENVLAGNGSDDLIKLISETFLEDGDEVVVPHPSFSQYGFGAAIMRAQLVYVPLNDDFTYDVERLLNAVTDRTKIVYLCSPNNPTGTILTQAQLDDLLAHLPSNVLVVIDFAYNDYSEHEARAVVSHSLLADPRVCTLQTFSKLYGLAGLRVGYGLAHAQFWDVVNRVREPFNVNRIGQRAAAAALGDELHRARSRALARESMKMYQAFGADSGVWVVPAQGNFALVKTGNAQDVTKAMMGEGVMVRSGFRDLQDYVRITFGTQAENQLCIQALQKVLKR